MKLLLIDPLILIRERLGAILANLGIAEVEITGTMEDAIQLMQTSHPDIAILHARLPDEKSIGMLVRLKSECVSTCVIVVSNQLPEICRKRWKIAGADYCFDISMQVDQLLGTVQQLCAATVPPPSNKSLSE